MLSYWEVLGSELVPDNSELKTKNLKLGGAVYSAKPSVAVENYDTDGSHHSNNQPHHNYLTEYL